MDAEVVEILKEIRSLVAVLTAVISAAVLVWGLGAISNIVANFKRAWAESFNYQALKLFESGNFSKLAEQCNEKLHRYPNHAHAIWWLAKSKLQTGEEEEAIVLFDRLVELEPSWAQSHVEPYLGSLNRKKFRPNITMESDT